MWNRLILPVALTAIGGFALNAASPMRAAEEANAIKSSSAQKLPLYERFEANGDEQAANDEVPDFQKHVSPLLGRLGCNGRACHGSFQGQGGFQLSLFGYDFDADHKALLDNDSPRVDLEDKLESLILTKPVDEDMHEGGKRYEEGGWQYWVLRRWIEAGAPYDAKKVQKLESLEVTPHEIQFSENGQTQQLNVIAHWEDGTSEDVTCLCRFQSNDAAIAAINEGGLVTAGEAGDTHVVVSYDNAVVPILALRPMSGQVGENYPQITARTEVDRRVAAKLKKLGIIPSDVCSDEVFLRRASLDVTGTLPTTQEVNAFRQDTRTDKRALKIEELLARPAYAAQWTTFLCDMTGNNEDQLRNFFPQNVRLENQWYQWIYKRVQENVPYDELVEGIVTAVSRLPDESYSEYCEKLSEICRDKTGEEFAERPGMVHYWARRNFQTAEDRAIGFAYTFLGVRIQCAQCHKHPFDQWAKSDFENFERLFGRVQARQNTMAPDAKKTYTKMVSSLEIDKELKGNLLRKEIGELMMKGETVPLPELVVSAPRTPKNKKGAAQPVQAKLLGGDWVDVDQADIRGKLMDWLRSPENPYFAKAITNRIWAQYFGVGIVNPPDDLNLANAPSNAPLLDYLADGFVGSGYDMKWLHREILNSDAYQRSWIPNATNRLDKHNFSHGLLRRLPAETAFDAVRMAVANDVFVDQARDLELQRAITKPGSSARSNNRDDQSYALSVFGRSVRESNCDCDRSSEPSLLQTVFLANDSAVQQWLTDSKTSWVAEVAEKFGWETPVGRANSGQSASPQARKQLKRFAGLLSEANEQIADAKTEGRIRMLESLQKKRAEIMKRAESMAKKNRLLSDWNRMLGETEAEIEDAAAQSESSRRMTQEQALWVAEHAYLRSLSRRPNAAELSIATNYLTSEDNPTSAVEGLIWSLINTKEFILNH